MNEKLRAGILGATGLVGQRLALMLDGHPWFEVTTLAASDRSAHKTYKESCMWRLPQPMPENLAHMAVQPVDPELDCDFVFSSLPSSMAAEVENSFARAGYPVISNSSSFRMEKDVPLLVPEINREHCQIIPVQRRNRGFDRGFIATNPNCTTIALVLGLAPALGEFGVDAVQVSTMQALSGAGQTGVSSMDIIDNVIPFIENEEAKVESEPLKIFGEFAGGSIEPAHFRISSQCNRVNVSDGHLLTVSVKLCKKPTEKEFVDAFRNFTSPLNDLSLPSAPERPVIVVTENDRPQPRLDRDRENGMVSVVGRIRPCNVMDYKYVVLGHNTIRGAAGAAVLNAELLKKEGFFRE